MAIRMPQHSSELRAPETMFQHRFDEHPGAEHLVILFAALVFDTTIPTVRWPYEARLAKVPAHRLYLRPQVAPVGDAILDVPALGEFLVSYHERIGIPPDRTIACGSSLGATCALASAARCGFGYVMAGSPIVMAGDYAHDRFWPEEIRTSVLRSRLWADDDDDVDSTERANSSIPNAIRSAHSPLTIDLFVGESDYFHPEATDVLADACADNPLVTLKRRVVPDVNHRTLYLPFGRHMAATLHQLVGPPAQE